MEISYKLERQDFINCLWYFLIFQPPKPFRNIRWFLRGFLLAIGFYRILLIWQKVSWDRRIFTISLWTIAYFLSEIINRLSALYLTRKQEIPKSAVIYQHTITLTEDELIKKTDVNQIHIPWEGIDELQENGNYLLIWFATKKFYIIPKRAFSDRSQY